MKPFPRPNVSPALLLVLQVGLSSVAYFFAQALAFKFPDSFGLLAAFWPASGIALAALLLNPRRRWPALLGCLFVAGLAANLTTERPYITSVGFMVANICETAAAAWLITRLCGPAIRFTRVAEVGSLAGAALLINAGTSLIGAGVAAFTMGRGFWTFYKAWYVVDGLGLLLVTPLIVVWAAPWRPLAGRRWHDFVELPGMVGLCCAVTWLAFGCQSEPDYIDIHPYMLLVFLVWAALRAGSRGMVTLLGLVTTIAIVCTATNRGSFPLGGADTGMQLLAVQLFLGVLGLTGMLLMSAISQQRESAALLQAVADGTSDDIYVKDRQGRYLFMNAAAARFVGKTAAEVTGKDDSAFFSAAEVAALQQEDRITLQSPVARVYEKCLTDGAGVERVLQVTTGPLCTPDGQVSGLFGSARDITERKRADEAILESEKRFTLLFEHLVVGFALHEIICDSDGSPCDYRFLAVNPAFEKLTGQKSQALIGRTVKEVWPETEPDWIQRYGAVALRGAPIHFDLFSKALGRQYEVSAYTPAPRQFATIVTDITDRIHAEAELRLQGSALRAAANAIVITDRQGNVVWANPAFTRLTGYAVSEMLGKNPRVLKSGEHSPDFYRELWETINAGQVWSSELVNKRKDGSLYTEEMTITPVRDDHDAITHFIAIKQDITARKQVEHALQASNRQLLEAAAELGAVQRQVIQQESLRALGQMASGMAHDFNNALSPIIGFSELLLKHRDKLADLEQAAKFLKLINIAGHDAADVVRRLREFGRQRGDGVVSDAIDLVGLIRQTIDLTQPRWKDQAQANGITIQMVTDLGKVPLFAGEEFAIRELLTNLIFNAVDALPTGGKITLGSAIDGNFVRLWVSDNGTGMTEEVRQRCFEPFYTTKEDQGSGLGLSMVHGIVQRHGGTVEIASELGRGTTFTIRLPVQEPRMASGLGTESALNRKMRVLVVDDEPVLCAVVREWLTADGHTVVTAENGAAALAQVRAAPQFELVITDKAMPNMNGEQLAVALTAIDPNLPIILMTGFGDLMKASGELPPHIRAILSKPITEASLREALAKVFPGSGAEPVS